MLPRSQGLGRVDRALQLHPVAALLGPRQCGKTTLARLIAARNPCEFFDLEDPVDVRRLSAPMTALERLTGLVIIDEVQRRPELFELLRVLVDRPDNRARFLVLGSASPRLVRGVSESLADRIGFVDLSGFDLSETGAEHQERLSLRGGFPRSFLAETDGASMAWRLDLLRTFLERDIPQLGITTPAETLRRFWTGIAHSHGQIWNAAELARSLGASENTARRYLDILAGAFVGGVCPRAAREPAWRARGPLLGDARRRGARSPGHPGGLALRVRVQVRRRSRSNTIDADRPRRSGTREAVGRLPRAQRV